MYKKLIEEHNVKFRKLPSDITKAWVEESERVIKGISQKDNISKKIYKSWNNFRINSKNISRYYDLGFLEARENYSKYYK